MSHKSNAHAGGESYNPIVPAKSRNKGGTPPADGVEGRGLTKENTEELNTDRIQSRVAVSQGLSGVRQAVLPPASKVGTVCGNSARTGLCGGRRVTGVPTATQAGATTGPVPHSPRKDLRCRLSRQARGGAWLRPTPMVSGV